MAWASRSGLESIQHNTHSMGTKSRVRDTIAWHALPTLDRRKRCGGIRIPIAQFLWVPDLHAYSRPSTMPQMAAISVV